MKTMEDKTPNPSAEGTCKFGIFNLPNHKTNPMEFLQVACGNALMGNPAQLCVFILGKGCTGKSTFINNLIDGLGKGFFHFADKDELYFGKYKPRKDSLVGTDEAKFSIQTEVPSHGKWRSDIIKKVCCHEEVIVKKNYRKSRIIRPTAMPIIVGNHLPDIENEPEGVKMRIHVVEFTKTYFDAGQITEEDRKRMAHEALEWALRGKQIFTKLNPLFNFETPAQGK